ncbi:fructose-bisphosphate aldolase class II [Barrientosiimonas humi]|uniref:Fructose-bisphosphate aldolase class II n=1 Tax=Barrientosiimonas humi TaxID=999931 RepID=A0A542XFV3_9MICO|nr:class II fructose-bisphosphate aldolase [Barrientosiimonas humi]TQL34708.1 fructose-bisphosphate aldolase class II [Barrientosiimonas humi]CAG7574698.1 D-tagatose-1,6-bisphosphate aldolase subunit GatY [Barrientosiimonas humi]
MTLANLTELLATTTRGAIAAFNVIQIEHAEAYAAAAAHTNLPVVMQISQNAVRYHGALAPIAAATLAVARASEQPVVVHLDHAEDEDLVREAVELGLTSVMYDGSRLPDEQNREATARVVQRCHDAGVSVEAELGEVGGKDGVHAPGVRTDPADAAQFVADTGVDALAVAVGSSHAMTSRTAELDVDLIARLREGVPVPLVLHGSSGVPDAGLVAAVRAGMRKVNIATHLNQVFTEAMQTSLREHRTVDTRRYLGAGRDAITAEAARLQQLLALEPTTLVE